jgi:flagellar assembly protein FliH
MSETLSRSQQSAWQRWELASLGAEGVVVGADPESAARATAEQEAARAIEQSKAEARDQGYRDGMAQAADRVASLERLLATLAEHAARHEQQLADEVLDLALLFARQLVGQAVNARRELVLPIVASALSQLPQATRQIQLHLDPADVALVRSVIPADHPGPPLSIVPDAKVGAGGCIVDTEQASVDATVASRWRRLLASLGRTEDWLDVG